MTKHEAMEMLDDEELDKVVGGVTVVGSWSQKISTEDFFTPESSQTESLENVIRRSQKKKKSDWLL